MHVYCTTSTEKRETVPRASKVCSAAETKDLCLKNKVKRELTLKITLRFPPQGCGARALPHVTRRKGVCSAKFRDQGSGEVGISIRDSTCGKWAPLVAGKARPPGSSVSRILLHSLPITHSNFSYPETKHCCAVVQSLGNLELWLSWQKSRVSLLKLA